VDKIVIRKATMADAVEIAEKLQGEQAESVLSLDSRPLRDVVAAGFEESTVAWCADIDGTPVAIWGVWPLNILTGIGYPWLFATAALSKHRRAALIVGKAAVIDMLQLFPRLNGSVDNRYEASVRYAKHLGFDVKPSVISPFSSLEMVKQ